MKIAKVYEIEPPQFDNDTYFYLTDGDGIYGGEIIKHSPNIIDLIEVGDYVNGKRVRATYLDGVNHYIKIGKRDKVGTRTYNEDIKSIVTKEQFEQMSYKVKE